MDSELLQPKALEANRKSIKQYNERKRLIAERAISIAQLEQEIGARAIVYGGISSIAVTNEAYPGESVAIPVGQVMLKTPTGDEVERSTYAVVRNNYGDSIDLAVRDLSGLTPDSILITYGFEAETEDVDKGIITSTGGLGWSATTQDTTMLHGQRIGIELYMLHEIAVPINSDLDDGPTNPMMLDTLKLLEAGVKELAQATYK
jgi:hypothetical protein